MARWEEGEELGTAPPRGALLMALGDLTEEEEPLGGRGEVLVCFGGREERGAWAPGGDLCM